MRHFLAAFLGTSLALFCAAIVVEEWVAVKTREVKAMVDQTIANAPSDALTGFFGKLTGW